MFQIIKNAFKFNNIIRDQHLTRFLEEIDVNVGNAWQKAKNGRRIGVTQRNRNYKEKDNENFSLSYFLLK